MFIDCEINCFIIHWFILTTLFTVKIELFLVEFIWKVDFCQIYSIVIIGVHVLFFLIGISMSIMHSTENSIALSALTVVASVSYIHPDSIIPPDLSTIIQSELHRYDIIE